MAEPRKTLSKRLRFEIFKRDNHRCLYCGAGVIDTVLHIDHVVAVANGGTDDPANLVTACRDCNGGKSAVPLEKRRLQARFTSDEDREHAEQIREYLKVQREIVGAKREAEELVLDRWEELLGPWHESLPRYLPRPLREQGVERVLEAVEIVARKGLDSAGMDAVRYFCGVLRNNRSGGPESPRSDEDTAAAVRDAEWRELYRCFDAYWEGVTTADQPPQFRPFVKKALGSVGGKPAILNRGTVFRLIDAFATWQPEAGADFSDYSSYRAARETWFSHLLGAEPIDDRGINHLLSKVGCERYSRRMLAEHKADAAVRHWDFLFGVVDVDWREHADRSRQLVLVYTPFFIPWDYWEAAYRINNQVRQELPSASFEERLARLRELLAADWIEGAESRDAGVPDEWPETKRLLQERNQPGEGP